MKKQFTKEYITAERGCYSLEQVNGLSFINNASISIEDILNSEITIRDKFWFLRNKTKLNDFQLRSMAIICAESVLEIFENKYPNDKRPRKAIEAAKDYLNKKIAIEELKESRAAAAAAYAYAADAYAAAAYAYAADAAAYAYAADAYAAAAYAAAAAAAAYAYAADAYAAAAYAYAADAYGNNYKQIILDAVINFIKEQA